MQIALCLTFLKIITQIVNLYESCLFWIVSIALGAYAFPDSEAKAHSLITS